MGELTKGKDQWNVACDSYGKVQHSRMACVYTTVAGTGGDRLVKVASRIGNWADASLIAAAPELLDAAQYVESMAKGIILPGFLKEALERLWLAAKKAKGEA